MSLIQLEEKIVDVNFFKEYYNVRKLYGENDKKYFNNVVNNTLDKFDINLSEGEFKILESKTIKSLLYKISVYNELFALGYCKKDNSEKPEESEVFKEIEKLKESEVFKEIEKLKESKVFKKTEETDSSDETDSSEETEVININSTIDIKRNAFGKEDLNYMNTENNSEYVFIVKCIKENFKGIINYIREVFFNKNQISNSTIRKKEKDFIEFYDGEKFCSVVDDIFLKKLMNTIYFKFRSKMYMSVDECKILKPNDIDRFISEVGVYFDFIKLCSSNKAYYLASCQIKKSDKNKVKKLYLKQILQEITNQSKTLV